MGPRARDGWRVKVSVFTPTNWSPYLAEAYASLCAQTHSDWEWVILGNGDNWSCPAAFLEDPRVRVGQAADTSGNVGALKREACGRCRGDVLVELDHDDVLHHDALREVVGAFQRDQVDFVYSDFAEFHTDTWAPNAYGEAFGWRGYDVVGPSGHTLRAMRAPTDPVDWRRIEWAPNHLRAWRRSFYERIGGHDASLRFADDHDLVLRSYLAGGVCHHIPRCIYFYRVHPSQNVKVHNADIQALEAGVYDKYIYRLAEKRARDNGTALIDLCGGIDCPEHYVPIDLEVSRAVGIKADLNGPWPLADGSVGVLRAFDALEHLGNPMHTMNEAWRVLEPGGMLLVMVPSTDSLLLPAEGGQRLVNGSGAFCDPTHVSFWNERSFRYYTDDKFRRYLPGLRACFQVSRLVTIERDGMTCVVAELIALKDGFLPMGEVLC